MYKKEIILDLINKRGKMDFRTLARTLKVNMNDNKAFSSFLFSLVDSGDLSITPDRFFHVPKVLHVFTDTLKLNAKGFGFIDHTNEDGSETSVFIPATNIRSAMDGDIVEVRVSKDLNRPDSLIGMVSKIVTRNKSTFVGRVVKFGDEWAIKPLDVRNNAKYRWVDTTGLELDYEVKAEIVEYGQKFHKIKLLKVLGHKDDVAVDIQAAIEDAGVPWEFNPFTIAEAKAIPLEVSAEDIKGRVDLRERMIVTIDGDDTKDFDDAVEVWKLPNGNFKLGVHIADVTHYVKEGQPLDDEALTRGTSVYLADRVIPMLPEALSNGICSLNPRVDRLVLSAEMEIDKEGNTVDYSVYAGVINSKHRLTYQQVNAYYRGNHSWDDPKLHSMLDDALELSRIIRKYKNDQGYIDFEIEEAKLIIDENGKTTNIIPRDRLESEMMIEDFMVRANETVAYHAAKDKLSFIYRVHDKPSIERVASLQNVIKVLGIDVYVPHGTNPKEFARCINDIKKTRFDDFMKILMLRTMAKAEYSPKNIGHFGLASEFYTHFTSPIRRYPDLMVHRMLRTYFLENNLKATEHFKEILPKIAEHSSATEVRSVELERKVADIKKAEYYERFIGESFEGTIVSMMGFGFFVEFPNKVDGLVHISSLVDGDYELSNGGYSLTNKKRTFTIGDKVFATVVAAQKEEGKIDLVVSDIYEQWKKIKDEHKMDRRR